MQNDHVKKQSVDFLGNSQLEEEDLYGDYDLDEDDEDDSDFIDDSEYAGDVSKHIRSIFNYDRRRLVLFLKYSAFPRCPGIRLS